MSYDKRPQFILSTTDIEEKPGKYPKSDEPLSYGRAIGKVAGLEHFGIHVERVPPGHRTSWPHAEEKEEEFVYVLEEEIEAWIDGVLHPMRVGDFAGFPAGTGICHTFINNSDRDARLLVGGDANRNDSRIYYPLNPERREDMPSSRWWDDVPKRTQAPHDGRPNPKARGSSPKH